MTGDNCDCCVQLYTGLIFYPPEPSPEPPGRAFYWTESVNGSDEELTIRPKEVTQIPCNVDPRPDMVDQTYGMQPATIVTGGSIPASQAYTHYTTYNMAGNEEANGGFSTRGDFEDWLSETVLVAKILDLNDGETKLTDGVCDTQCNGTAEPDCTGMIRMKLSIESTSAAPEDTNGQSQGEITEVLATPQTSVKDPRTKGQDIVTLWVDDCGDYASIAWDVKTPNGNRIGAKPVSGSVSQLRYQIAVACGTCDPYI